MKEIAVYDAKTRFSELLAEVERGEQFLITRHGTPVARLVAAVARRSKPQSQRDAVADVLAELTALRSGVTLDVPLRKAVEAGRD